jgi:hypothetical protein
MADMKNSHRSFHRHRQIALQHAAWLVVVYLKDN